MEKLKVEYTAFDFMERMPSKKFFGLLTKQLTPKIETLIDEDVLCDCLWLLSFRML